jgi:hypothetical protein
MSPSRLHLEGEVEILATPRAWGTLGYWLVEGGDQGAGFFRNGGSPGLCIN